MKKLFVLLLLLGFSFQCGAISIGKRVTVSSSILDADHQLLVYTPPSYDYTQIQKYPVLYIVDGDYNFHYLTGLIELWSNISAFIPEMIVVGISGGDTETYRELMKPPLTESTVEAGAEKVGRADVMLKVLKSEIMPYIEKQYRVSDFEILGGHSMGGLFVTYASIHKPEMFDRFIAISPSLWWQNESMKSHAAEYLKKHTKLRSSLYLTLANEKGMGVHGFIEMLESKRRGEFTVKFKQFPDETHGSVGLASYQWALFDLFESTRLAERYFESADAVKKQSERLIQAVGSVMPIPSGYLRNSCYAWCGDEKMRSEIDRSMAQYFPGDVAFYRGLVATHLLSQGQLEQAGEWIKKAELLAPDYVVVHHLYYQLYEKSGAKSKAKKAKKKIASLLEKQNIRQWQRNEMKLN